MPRSLVRAAAPEAALMPLLRFVGQFEQSVGLSLLRCSEQVADYACDIAADKKKTGIVRRCKGFDAPV